MKLYVSASPTQINTAVAALMVHIMYDLQKQTNTLLDDNTHDWLIIIIMFVYKSAQFNIAAQGALHFD